MGVGRVGNNQLTRKLMFQVNKHLLTQEKLFEQVSTNKRINRSSDDPVGTSQSMKLRDQLKQANEYENVIKTADAWTNISSISLDNAISTWKRVNEVAISSSDGTKTEADRMGMAEELEQLLQHLTQIGNASHGGRYIFGGSETGKNPFRVETDQNTGRVTGVFFEGNSDIQKIQSKEGGEISVNVLGSNAGNPDLPGTFIDNQTGASVFTTLIELRNKLLNNDIVGISGDGGILEKIEKGARSLTSAQVRIGGTQSVLQLDKNRLINENSTIEQSLSEVEDADTAKIILELNNVQNVYEASLAAGGRLLSGGLLKYI